MRGKVNIKTILVMVILLLVGVLGFLGLNTVKTYMSGASADTEPTGVTAKSDDDGKGATVTWASDKPSMGVVEYGTTPASLLLRAVETEEATDHRVSLSPLRTATNYYFRIRIGEEVFDNGGIPYSFKTKGDGGMPPSSSSTLTPTNKPTTAAGGLTPTVTPATGNCSHDVDYNGDGVTNSLDYLDCLKGRPRGKNCDDPGDLDGNGVVNSLDRLKCLQNGG